MPSTPRCFIIRHGETEWSLNGKHTGTTDLPLTEDGEKRVKTTGNALVGHDRLIVPKHLAHIYVSPRQRAQRTLELLEIGCKEPLPWLQERQKTPSRTEARVEITEAIREWDYGDYEGMKSAEIRELRAKNGEGSWDIWRDGCPGGESADDVTRRLDALIAEIRLKYHSKAMTKSAHEPANGDVLIVAHGHILRAFAMRWIGKPLTETAFILEAGGVGTLSYEHHNIDEPAIILGGAFVVGD
ncbi:2,3-bisphosphoglycerate-dependent phosphoglycerate mutase [Blastomyces dermatitidis ATCC 26199]|nr:2,3-bisphosphoglycerate-dependent phosphoglycerate mutase [Blastomyces dermatitidis ATCC 26199]